MTASLQWHKVWHLGDDVDTDALAPGAFMQHGVDVIAKHCLANLLPSFAQDVRRGDVVVAGRNFGIGSSREQAAAVLVHLGVAAVVAPSFGGLFFRNAFNLGLMLVTCPQSEALQRAASLALAGEQACVQLPSGERLACEPIPDFLLEMVRSGGLMASLRRRLATSPSIPGDRPVA